MSDDFHGRLVYAMAHYCITNEQVARKFHCSKSTVSRWKTGKSAPHPVMQPVVLHWVERGACDE